jgi:urease accessory protein
VRTKRWSKAILIVAVLLALPVPASAHATNTGLGPFYDGLAHFFLSPEDVLPVVALSLLGGLRGPRFGRVVMFALPAAWMAGAVLGMEVGTPIHVTLLGSALIIALGVLVAADKKVSLAWVVSLTVLVGLLHGYQNGVPSPDAQLGMLGAVGIGTAVFVVAAVVGGQVSALRAHWARMVVRVGGSWVAAIGLLMFGWLFRAAR